MATGEDSQELITDLRRRAEEEDGLALIRSVLRSPLGGRIALVSSFGAESVVLLDMVASVEPATPVVFLDTGRLFAETLAYREKLCALLRLSDVRHIRPEPASIARYDESLDLFARDPDFCCQLRKSEPMEQALDGFAGWITGRKRFQGGARVDLPVIEIEPASGRLKLNPLARWSLEDVRHYRRLRQLPLHPLSTRGYGSIGCAPCTTPIRDGEPPRAGRWRGLDKLECGIH
jgi:phosphoadenosine phosphosulfate reductase